MRKLIPILFIVLVVVASGCISVGDQPTEITCVEPEKLVNNTCCFDNDNNGVCDINEKTCPASCDDSKLCTNDYCSLQTNFECRHNTIRPCCGNGECEPSEDSANECPADCKIIKITNFYHSLGGPDYMENETYVFIHTGSNETDKQPYFYLNITADQTKLVNIRSTYNCTDSATNTKIDSITADRVPVVPDFPTEFGYENKFEDKNYVIYTSFYTKEPKSLIEVSELLSSNTTQFKVRIMNKNYKIRSRLTCDFYFYFLEPLKKINKNLKISYI